MRKSTWSKLLPLCMVLILTAAVFGGCGGDPTGTATDQTPQSETASTEGSSEPPSGDDTAVIDSFPRNETLYFNGLAWGAPTNWNPFSANPAEFITINVATPRVVIYETLFIFNQLDNQLYPLLGTDYSWEGTTLTVNMNTDAKWNDGTQLTAEDVVYTYELGKEYDLWISSIWSYIDSITATDESTVQIHGIESGFNPKVIEESISKFYIVPKHIWEQYEEEVGHDGAQLMQLVNDSPVASGPYTVYSYDDTKLALIRVDDYWGQAASMWDGLAEPKYLVHNVFKDNAAGDAAFKAGQVDIAQQFISQVWKMWEDGAEVETYLEDAPYYLPGSIPSIVFNTTRPGLDDKNVRKAIAMVLDYDLIGQNAMSGYTAKLVPSLMLPTDPEQALIDANALTDYQWDGVDTDGAIALLEEAGWVLGSDGVREKDGVKLSFTVECPSGWTDWMASLEVVAQSTKSIGIDIQTSFPEQGVWNNNRNTGDFDILMNSYDSGGIASPWNRVRLTMSSEDVPEVGTTAYYNYGRWHSDRANEIINELINPADDATEKALWTELNQIYLDEMPCAGLMYRPRVFHTVNTSVWDGYPRQNDGSNIPPDLCIDGYGIAGLYNLKAK